MATRVKKKKLIDEGPKIVCQNKDCIYMGKHQSPSNFYKSRNPLMPHHPFCKDCVNSMVDINNMQSVYDVLKVLDTPFIMDVWNAVVDSGVNNILGTYLGKINTAYKKKYDGWTFDDSVYELSEQEKVSPKVQEALDEIPVWSDEWQGDYTKSELDYLNNYYQGLQNDFKIVTTNHKDYAKKIAKASLAMDMAYQDMLKGKDKADAAYEKATRNFDMLSKSAQFAESQRGANDVALGCFGRIFDAVEKHNWIPSYIPTDEDMYDKLLKQFSNIERSL